MGIVSEQQADIEALRARLVALEAENEELRRRSGAAVAAARRQAAWLEELDLDLNALMGKRGAHELRAAFRGARAAYWLVRYRAPRRLRRARDRLLG